LGVLILNFTIPGPGIAGTELDIIKRQPYLLINKQGKRFCDEEIVTNWPYGGNAIAKQKDKMVFLIFEEVLKYMEIWLITGRHPSTFTKSPPLMPGSRAPLMPETQTYG
jgi:hypothetical protein